MKKVASVTLFFFCIIVFSAAPPASAHDGINAEEASTGDMEDMKDFLLHLKRHRAQRVTSDEGRIEFRNAMRNNNGVWRHGDTYVITVNKSGDGAVTGDSFQSGDIILFHGKHPGALSASLRGIPVFRRLMERVEEAGDEVVCVQDDRPGRGGGHICAVEDSDTGEAGDSFIHVGGFDHEVSDVSFDKIQCPNLGPEYFGKSATRLLPNGEEEEFTRTNADMVVDEESLKNYLKTVDEHITEEFAKVSHSRGRLPLARMVQLMPCWREPPWQSGSIYFYIIIYTDKQYGIFNGLTPQFQDTSLILIDENNLNVGQEVREIVEEQNEGFLTYLWDDPVVSGDEVVCEQTGAVPGTPLENEGDNEDEEVFCEAGSPIPGRSPGTSVKRGYFIRTDFGIGGTTDYVLGSGIYPKSEEGGGSGGGGGCAIAAGSGNELGFAALNLFFIAAALFLATSGKSRPGEKLLTLGLRARRKDRHR
ncbi:MAG: hypothetical protein OXC39_01185 [Candidatus Dadabacteria bacterium]|nr:hypothetical protein [Candidatus Dadabacteria bacterium]